MAKQGCKYLEDVKTIDYKDYELLRKFMTEQGKITPRRITGANASSSGKSPVPSAVPATWACWRNPTENLQELCHAEGNDFAG